VTTEKLAAALKADLLRQPTSTQSSSVECFLCGRSYTYKRPSGDDSGRFCSNKCRDGYDAGCRKQELVDPFKPTTWRVVAGGSPGYLPSTPMRPGKVVWYITCPGCQREFESKGLRYCSAECERRRSEQSKNLALMAKVGMEIEAKRKCEHCGENIPRWRNGRQVSTATRFCSARCQRKARRAVKVP
jgi:endogenous inhibitor of DNA gyrase (YacG/DUF329 family)